MFGALRFNGYNNIIGKAAEAMGMRKIDFIKDLGESEAIVLANNIDADLIIIDERKARRITKDIGLNVTGTLGILVEAKQRGLVKELKPLLDKLIKNDIGIGKSYTRIF